ncbi:glycosyltransferase [Listeria weihenstephanensis]|uniref:Glycosyltransferase n=1 Tax=Listeria weihenstephanensis TaxID=1006155 RepID=A0A841ZBN9_9LIST|nr:glycosyltransferase [Listeria weihenstephanensis]MBC1501703.1 glycosyltransferase [Listeria weihenstephanensis]
MKVLFLISSFPKLSETFILNQITGFIDRGIDVEIVAWNKVENKKDHPQVAAYNLLEKTHFLNFPTSRGKRFTGGLQLFFKHVWRSPKAVFSAFNYKKYGKMIFTLRFLYALPFFMKKEKYDAVICHYGPNGSVAAFLKEQNLLPEKTLVFFHGHDITSFVDKMGSHVYESLLDSDITLLPVNELFANKLLEIGADPNKIQIHHMGIDLNEYGLVSLGPIGEITQFLSIGRLTEKKGMDVAIKAMAEMKKRGFQVSLDIIGEGELRAELETLIETEGLQQEVTLLGWQSQGEINLAIAEANIILQLSKTASNGDKEGIPVVLMEAMGRGKLIVSTEHSGIPELIKNDVNGWLVPENDVVKAVEKIIEIKNNQDQWKLISLNARATIQEQFNIMTLNDQLDLYSRTN